MASDEEMAKDVSMTKQIFKSDMLEIALGEYLGWTGDPVATLKAAISADPDLILGHGRRTRNPAIIEIVADPPRLGRAEDGPTA